MSCTDGYVYFIKLEDFPVINTKLYFDIDLEQYNVEVDGFITLVTNQVVEAVDYINTLIQDHEYEEVHHE